MNDKNINLRDNEAEKLRFTISMLPTALLKNASYEVKNFFKELKQLPKKPLKQKLKFANIFNNLMTTQNDKVFSFTDINFVAGEVSNEPYQILLRSLGAESFTKLYEHAKLVDECINNPFNKALVFEIKNYLETAFNYYNEDIKYSMPVDEFYTCLILSFIAHLDACIHFNFHSEIINPISFGWLFMHKPDPKKWKIDSNSNKYILLNKNHDPYTKPSRSFIELLQNIGYWHTNKEMPSSIYGIDSKIDWKTDDPDGKLYDFLRRKKEGKWISLEDVYWLLGFLKSPTDERNKTVENWQKSFANYIKSEDITKLGELPPSAEGMIWFIYAFFQFQYIELEKKNKQNKERVCILYPEYYDLWQCITNYYESYIEASVKNKRIEWSTFLKNKPHPLRA